MVQKKFQACSLVQVTSWCQKREYHYFEENSNRDQDRYSMVLREIIVKKESKINLKKLAIQF